MDSDDLIGFLIIIIVFGGIVAGVAGTIYDSHKERNNKFHEPTDRSDTHETTKSTVSTVTKTTSTSTSRTTEPTKTTTSYTRNNTNKESSSGTSLKTIYAFRGKNQIRLCPFCDGENELEAKVCNICRRDL